MFFCPDCHVSNRPDAKFCRKCGKSRSDLERAGSSVAVAEVSESKIVTSESEVVVAESKVVVAESKVVVAESKVVVAESKMVVAESKMVAAEPTVDAESVVQDAPSLAVNIEQEESLTAPPDLNTPECPSCWKALRATDKFCCWCGEAQPNRVLPFLKLCLECSTFLPEKANYCYSCGTDVGYSSRRKVRVPHELFKDEESEFFPRFDA